MLGRGHQRVARRERTNTLMDNVAASGHPGTTATGLEGDTRYAVRVQAAIEAGWGPAQEIEVTTGLPSGV